MQVPGAGEGLTAGAGVQTQIALLKKIIFENSFHVRFQKTKAENGTEEDRRLLPGFAVGRTRQKQTLSREIVGLENIGVFSLPGG